MKISDRLRWSTFSGKLFIFGAVGSAGTIFLLSAIWLFHAWMAIDRTVHRDLHVIAIRTAGEIDQFLSGKFDGLKGMKELLSYPDEDRFKLNLMLKRIELEFNQYSNITLFDSSNRVIASSIPDVPPSLSEEILGTVKKGKTYRSPLLFSKDNLPYVKLAFPLFWQGEVFRVLVADIDILTVWNMVDDIKIGKTGRASVISETGAYLADADKGRVLKQKNLTDIFSLKDALTGNNGITDVRNRNGTGYSFAYAEIPSTGWRLVVTQTHGESMQFLYVMLSQAGLIMLAVLVLAYYVSVRMARKIAQPVEELRRGIEEIGKNNFKYEIPELYGDEFSALGKGINSMAKSLEEKEKAEKRLVETERMAAVGKLAGDVSHEINNPLAIMKNYIYVMRKNKTAEDDSNQKYLKIIDGEIDRVSKIIRDFNDLYKGTMIASLEEVDVVVPLGEVLAFCKEDLTTKGITVEERVDEGGKVVADKDKLKQVFLNLIKNAGEAMPDGGRITVATRKESGRIYVSVTDTGTGIKPAHIKKVFDPFFTTKGVKGLGLGLAVTYGIIKNFSGDIEVASEVGKGTTFTVMLPISSD